jgi:serine/threonine protein kinase
LGTNIYTGERVAVKLELQHARNPKLATEYKIYRLLAGGVGIPGVHWFGTTGKYNALVLDALGPSLYDLFKFCGRKFTLKTVILLADQLLSRMEYIHNNNIIHRDIKPDNLVMGLDMNLVYVIDFGLAKSYCTSNTRQIFECRSRAGTGTYASINNHLGMEQSRRDDLESLGFTLIYFARGRLPWQGHKSNSREEFHRKILLKKINTPIEVLCKRLPVEFATYLNYCRTLDLHEKPDYNSLRQLFRKLYICKGYSTDYQFDWNELNNKYSSSSKKITEESV